MEPSQALHDPLLERGEPIGEPGIDAQPRRFAFASAERRRRPAATRAVQRLPLRAEARSGHDVLRLVEADRRTVPFRP